MMAAEVIATMHLILNTHLLTHTCMHTDKLNWICVHAGVQGYVFCARVPIKSCN